MKASVLLAIAGAGWASASVFHNIEQRQTNWTVGQTVQTSSGPVSGHTASNASQVSEYLGIPFGQAPVGDLRFAAPVAFNGTAALNGSSFGFSCPLSAGSGLTPTLAQILQANVTAAGIATLAVLSNSNAKFSEDCLYLNVWTKPQAGDAKKAVLVWFYGGGFSSGSSSIPAYNGANIVEQEDVIVVSLNYRLSILGFPGSPNGTQNLGLLDQRLAVQWVRDNIANFGGDPSRITLFGQSAGAVSVDLYSYAWNSDPIVAGLIPESGTVFSWGLPNSKTFAANSWFNVSTKVGCGNASSDASAVMSCMRTKNYTTILNAVPSLGGTAGILGLFGPTVDDTVVFSNYTGRTPAQVPMLVGNNNYEGGLFRTEFALDGLIYPDSFWDTFNLQEFTCPTGIRANVSAAAGIPIWRYRYFGIFPNLAVSSEAGTWHAAEVPMLFNTMPSSTPSTTDQISIGNYMRGAWATFAKNPTSGLTTYGGGWPVYNSSGETLIRLAYNNVTGTNLAVPSVYDYNCKYVNVSSTDATNYPVLPDAPTTTNSTASVSGTAAPSGTAVSSGSVSGTATGSAASATATKSGASSVSVSMFVVFVGGMLACLL